MKQKSRKQFIATPYNTHESTKVEINVCIDECNFSNMFTTTARSAYKNVVFIKFLRIFYFRIKIDGFDIVEIQ